MTYQLFVQQQPAGRLRFDGIRPVLEDASASVRSLIDDARRHGITRWREIERDNERLMVEVPVATDDRCYELAFAAWLRRQGLTVIDERPELDHDVLDVLERVTIDPTMAASIRDALPEATVTEKTMILDALRQLDR